jgi:putative flippase GtrA
MVGVIGIGVQLIALAVLTRAGLHYLPATITAVEIAVVHNFAWHERWTWRDRTRHAVSGMIGRLARFNVTTGAVSLGGNIVIMALLVGRFGMRPIPANIVAIGVCNLANFLAADLFVFRRRHAAAVEAARPPLPVSAAAPLEPGAGAPVRQ